jgi:S1-C subfamily serine protease
MRAWGFFAVALISAIVCLPSSSAYSGAVPAPETAFTFNKWAGQAYIDDRTGHFSHCAVATIYVSGTTMLFAVFPNASVNIGFARPDWKFTKGQTIPGEIRIDRGFSINVVGVAYLPNAVAVTFPPTAPIFAELAHGYALTVLTQGGSVGTFSLKDSYRALELAHECAIKYQAKFGAQQNAEMQRWLARNPWLNDPRYSAQAQAAFTIDRQLAAEGRDNTTSAYYAELDERLRKAGVAVPAIPNTAAPAVAAAPAPPPEPAPKKATFVASGTGIAVTKDGYIITNNHVIASCIGDVHGNLTGQPAEKLRVVSTDEANDLALLKAPIQFQGHAVVRAASIRPGDGIIVIGYPYQQVLSSEFAVTTGIISSLGGIGNDSRYLQISAAVQPGNSGGPLLDESGDLVGVVSEKLDVVQMLHLTGSIPENVNFAIKTGALRDFLDKNAVSYDIAMPAAERKVADIADRARSYTLHISCQAKRVD